MFFIKGGVMTKKLYKRKKFIIHYAVQVRYILMSVLPALIVSVFCILVLVKTGENMIQRSEIILNRIDSYGQMLNELQVQGQPRDVLEKILTLKIELLSFRRSMQGLYLTNMAEWDNNRLQILFVLFFVLFFVMILAVIYSHRIAGPIYRVKRYLDIMALGKDVPPPISFRKHDEFKEIAESLNKVIEMMDTDSGIRPSQDLK